MRIPEGYAEPQVIKMIKEIIGALSTQFRFGYFEKEDLEQEGWIFALEALEKYDPTLKYSLNNFLYGHIRRRFINFKRNNYTRSEPPCVHCPFYDPRCQKSENQCSTFTDKLECDKWARWVRRNERKRSLSDPIDVQSITDEANAYDDHIENRVTINELIQIVDEKLDISLRKDYLKMLNGVKIPPDRRDAIIKALEEIFDNAERKKV